MKLENSKNGKARKKLINTIKNRNGITLIALVVTIVVLLILAGITISLVFSENGIIAKAREAAEKTNQAVINEQAQMNELIDYMGNMLNEIGGGTTPEEPEKPIVPESWDTEKVNPVLSEDNQYVPVPKGYTASEATGENTVENGFVIYENTNGEDKDEPVTDESDIKTAQETRNQFVWVPVENPSDMYGTDSTGKKWGKLYEFSENGITPLNWIEQNGIMTITDKTSYREPDVVTGNGTEYDAVNSNLQQAGLGEDAIADTFKTQLETEFNNMIASVEQYGGFYIGRYETGNLGQAEAAVIKNNTDIANQTWYTQYNKSKGIAANSNVTTTMMWGCQWDAVMRWMYNSGYGAKKQYIYDSTGKGNYGTSSLISTGSNPAYAVNNIYDMAGNEWELTVEAYNTNCRGLHGGNCDNDANNSPVSSRTINIPPNINDGCRISLYVK